MESDQIPVVLESTSREQDYADDQSKNLEHLNSSRQEYFHCDYKQSSKSLLEHSPKISTQKLEININEPAFEPSFSTEDQNTSSKQISNELLLSKEANKIQLSFSDETESSEIIHFVSVKNESTEDSQPTFSKETESKQKTQLVISEEIKLKCSIQQAVSKATESNKDFQPTISEKTDSNQDFQLILSDEVKINQKFQTAFTKETESNQEIQSAVSEMTKSNHDIQPDVSEETKLNTQPADFEATELNKDIQPVVYEETGSNRRIQSALSEKTELNQDIQLVISDEVESPKTIELAFPGETESTQVILSTICEENEVIRTPVLENTASTVLSHPDLPEEAKLPKIQSVSISEKYNLNNGNQFESLKPSYRKTPILSSVSENSQIPLNDSIVPSSETETASKGHSKTTFDTVNPGENSDLPLSPALDVDNFLSLLNTDEYRNGSHFVLPGGQVIVTPSTPCKPILENFEIPSLLTPNSSPVKLIKHSSSSKDTTFTKEANSNRSLSTLSNMLADWLGKRAKECSNIFEQHSNMDFIDYSKRELGYGLDLLQQMNKRTEILLKATNGLPDLSSILQQLESENMFIRDSVKYGGVIVQCRLEALQAEAALGYNQIISFCTNDLKLNDGFGNGLATKAKDIYLNIFLKISEDFPKLSMDIQRFRGLINDFCLKMDKLL